MFGRRHDPRIDALARVPFFSGCDRPELETVAKVADEASFSSGEVLMREGELGHEAFVLLRGEAIVTIGSDRVATLHPGDIVGEMALIEHEPRSATVVARDDVEALVLTNRGFNAVLDASPNVAWRVMAPSRNAFGRSRPHRTRRSGWSRRSRSTRSSRRSAHC